MEHHEAHKLLSEGAKPDKIDSTIAAKFTGVDRDHLRYIRKHCSDCNANTGKMFKIPAECSQMVRALTTMPDALRLEPHPFKLVERTDSGLDESLSTDSTANKIVSSSDHKYSSVLWIGMEDKMTEPLSTQVVQHRYVTAANSAYVPSCFLRHRALDLLRTLGPAFVKMDREHVTIHQSVVTASILEDSTECQVRYQTASWLQEQISYDSSFLNPKTIMMPAWRRYDSNHITIMGDIFTLAGTYESGIVRSFPTRIEFEHAHGKIGDIQALDQIAQRAPSDWSFRPTTCDCTSRCRLSKVGVLKRTHSCGSEHVIVRPTASDVSRHLGCLVDQRRMSKRKLAHSAYRWFHQEFVEGLQQVGEFRVFVVTMRDAMATRGRRGEVIEVVHTLELKDRELVVTVLTSSSMRLGTSDTYGKVNIQELKRFALYVFEALRKRPDWSTNFESLEVGARVDVGVSLMGDSCHYFVNEITRIYEADVFAEWLAQPGTHICRALSTALGEVFIDSSI